MGKNHPQTRLWCLGGICGRAQRAPWRRESAGVHPVRIFSEAFSDNVDVAFATLEILEVDILLRSKIPGRGFLLVNGICGVCMHMCVCTQVYVCVLLSHIYVCVFLFLWFLPVTGVPGQHILLGTLAAVVTPVLATCPLCYPLSPTLPPLSLSVWDSCSFRPSHLCVFQILARHCTAAWGSCGWFSHLIFSQMTMSLLHSPDLCPPVFTWEVLYYQRMFTALGNQRPIRSRC